MRIAWIDRYSYEEIHADWQREAQRERLVKEALGNPGFYLPGDVQMVARALRRAAAWLVRLVSPSRPDQSGPDLPYQPRRRHGI